MAVIDESHTIRNQMQSAVKEQQSYSRTPLSSVDRNTTALFISRVETNLIKLLKIR